MNKNSYEHEEHITTADGEYLCLFRRESGGGYLVTCSEVPPMIAFGETLAAARATAKEELEGWLEIIAQERNKERRVFGVTID